MRKDSMQDRHQVGRDHWKGRSDAWTATAPTGLSTDDTLNQLIIQNLDIKAGENVLDLGFGHGDLIITIGLSLDEAGTITACDLTPEMLVTARSRANNIGLSVIRFAAADMKDLAFADNSFGLRYLPLGLMFPEDKVSAAREVRRVKTRRACGLHGYGGRMMRTHLSLLFGAPLPKRWATLTGLHHIATTLASSRIVIEYLKRRSLRQR